MHKYSFTVNMDVLDYECDIQGIVNNGIYLNYLEHARHEYLKEVGINFAEYAGNGINFVVVRAELDYKLPLRSGDTFTIGLNMQRGPKTRFPFHQDLIYLNSEKTVMKAKIIGTTLNERGRPFIQKHWLSIL